MIPYDELVQALARWRTQNGLTNTAHTGRRAAPVAVVAAAAVPPPPPGRASGGFPAAAAFPGAGEGDEATAHHQAAPPSEFDEGTEIHDGGVGEIDVDAEGMVMEEDPES
jgi:hypothetical protein